MSYKNEIEPETETIEPIASKYGKHQIIYWYCKRGIYPQHSILAGDEYRQLIKGYDSLNAAIENHPTAIVYDYDTGNPTHALPLCPPDWFDPDNAGEVWSEKDY